LAFSFGGGVMVCGGFPCIYGVGYDFSFDFGFDGFRLHLVLANNPNNPNKPQNNET
jgi:hypothetical protein